MENDRLPPEMRRPRPQKPKMIGRGKTMTRWVSITSTWSAQAPGSAKIIPRNCLKSLQQQNSHTIVELHPFLFTKECFMSLCLLRFSEEMQEAQWQASQANMSQCSNCGRKFAQDRIATHQRICKNINSKSARGSRSQPQQQAPELVRPRSFTSLFCLGCWEVVN